jgi:hypothetical protein
MTRSRASSGGIDGGTTDGEGISGEGTGGGGEVEDEVFWDAGFRQNARHMVMDCLEVVVQQCSVNMVLKGMRKVPYAVSVGGTWLSFLAVGAQGRGRYVYVCMQRWKEERVRWGSLK